MPGLSDAYFVLAFDLNSDGEPVRVADPIQVESRREAVQAAERMFKDHPGVVAWKRHANPAVGEIGEPEVICSLGHPGDFG